MCNEMQAQLVQDRGQQGRLRPENSEGTVARKRTDSSAGNDSTPSAQQYPTPKNPYEQRRERLRAPTGSKQGNAIAPQSSTSTSLITRATSKHRQPHRTGYGHQCDEWRRRIPKIRRAHVAQDWCNADTATETHKQLSSSQLITPIMTHLSLSADGPRPRKQSRHPAQRGRISNRTAPNPSKGMRTLQPCRIPIRHAAQ